MNHLSPSYFILLLALFVITTALRYSPSKISQVKQAYAQLPKQLKKHSTADWERLFIPDMSILEIIIRGSVMYLGLFFILRLFLKREAGTLGMADLLVIVLLADAAQNGMAGDYKSLPDGLLLVLVIVSWAYLLDFIGYKFPFLQKIIFPPPLLLIKDGTMLKKNLRRELITESELKSYLREEGIEDVAIVKKAYMEPDGRISVITTGKKQ